MLYKINLKNKVIYGNEKFIEALDKEILKLLLEYNLDMSAEHPKMDDDIVRYSEETQRHLG